MWCLVRSKQYRKQLHHQQQISACSCATWVALLIASCAGTANGFTSPLSLSIPLLTSLQNSYLDWIGPDRQPPRPQSGHTPSVDLGVHVVDRQSNLFFRRELNYQSVNEDPQQFDMERRSVFSLHVVFQHLVLVTLCTLYRWLLDREDKQLVKTSQWRKKNSCTRIWMPVASKHWANRDSIVAVSVASLGEYVWMTHAMKQTNLLSDELGDDTTMLDAVCRLDLLNGGSGNAN